MSRDFLRTRLNEPMDRKVLNFLSSLEDDLWIAKEDVIGTEAHNIMLYEQKFLNDKEIKSILLSLENFKEMFLRGNLKLDEDFEDIHPFIEKFVIDEVGIEIGGKIHTGRSRNDQVSVDIRLKIRDELNHLSEKLFNFIDVLIKLSETSYEIYMPLYTHLQRGQLGVFAHYLNNYIGQILRSLERIEEIYKRIDMNPLGACAIGGTSININRKRTAELLGFEKVIENSIDAISSRDYIFETLSCLSLISIQFTRISEDLLIWTTKEFNFIELDDKYCSVSSVMPQKKNPDTLELIRSKSSRTISNIFTASMIIKATPSGYFRDFQELKPLLKNSFELLPSVIEMFIGIFSTMKINSDIMLNVINDSFIRALDLAELLVQDYNIPFRQAHEIVAKLVKDSKNPKTFLNINRIEEEIFAVLQKEIKITNEFIDTINDLSSCLEKRVSQGSPSKIEVEKCIKVIRKKRTELYEKWLKRVERINTAAIIRNNIIKKLIS